MLFLLLSEGSGRNKSSIFCIIAYDTKRSAGIAMRRNRILSQKRPAAGEEKWLLMRECTRHILVIEGEKWKEEM